MYGDIMSKGIIWIVGCKFVVIVGVGFVVVVLVGGVVL